MTNDLPANLSRAAKAALKKWGVDACRTAWRENHLHGEGPTVCSIESGIPIRSVESAISAYREVFESGGASETPSAPRVIAMNPARTVFVAVEVAEASSRDAVCDAIGELVGKDIDSYEVLDRVDGVSVSPEEIAAAVRRTDCASVTLTDAQRERAAVLLADALRDLIDYHLPRLIGNAQLDAAEGA